MTEKNNLKFEAYGNEYDVRMTRAEYSSNQSICIPTIVESTDDKDASQGEDYGYITVNIEGVSKGNIVVIDDNNGADLANAFMEHIKCDEDEDGKPLNIEGDVIEGQCFGEWYGFARSGFCEYHVVELSQEFVDSLENYYEFDRNKMSGPLFSETIKSSAKDKLFAERDRSDKQESASVDRDVTED